MAHKTIGEATANLEGAVAYIPARYAEGVKKADWYTPASSAEAEDNYAVRVSEAIANKSRQKGIQACSNEIWRAGAAGKGAANIGAGIRAGLPKYTARMGPVLEAMNNAADMAPAKGTDFRQNIANRLVPVIEAAKAAAGKA